MSVNTGGTLVNLRPILAPFGIALGSSLYTTNSYAQGINESGQVVGFTKNPDPLVAFSWSNGVATDLGAFGGFPAAPRAINNSGANAVLGSAFDDGTNPSDGRMSWQSAVAWAASLNLGGVTGWRLPTTAVPDATCTDPTPAYGFSCTGSEMGHLFYVELGGDPNTTILTSGDPALLALFSNIQGTYWSGTTEPGFPDYAMTFTFTQGNQSDAFKTTNFTYGWAVHDGDVAAIPAPGAAWLLGTGLLALMQRARRRMIRGRNSIRTV